MSTFAIVAEPSRRRILDLLRERARSVGELVAELGLSQPGVSKHLRVLREAGLVGVRRDAQRRWYELRTEPLRDSTTGSSLIGCSGASASTTSNDISTKE